ncbi:unnamed protein product [Diamesa serratosioi]
MNVIQNKKKGASKVKKREYHQKINFEVYDANPDLIINQKVLNEISKDFLGNTTTANNSSESQVIVAITEGRGHARGEIGIAAIDLNSPALIMCQLSDNFYYTDTLNKVQTLNPVKILLPDTIFEALPLPKLIELIKVTFEHVHIIPIQRRHFNDKIGLEMITRFCSTKSVNILQMIAKKYYCLSSASALLSFLKTVNLITFGQNCLKLDYQTKHFGMMIDPVTSSRLELLYSQSTESNATKKFSLFAILNRCVTRIGQRHLRANILEPSCDINFIRNRQEQVQILIDNSDLHLQLKEILMNFSNVDRLLKVSYILPADDCEKAIQTNIQTSLLLKNCLEAIKPLTVLLDSAISECFSEMKDLLCVPVFKEIIDKINEIVQPDIHMNKQARKHFQFLYAVKANVNETIDFLRQLYAEAIDKIRDYVADLTAKCNLPLKMIHSAKLGYHLFLKNPNNLPLPAEFNIYKRGNNMYITTTTFLTMNETTQTIGFDVIRMSNTILCDMLIEIAKDIDAIYHLIGTIIDLDIIQSLAEVSAESDYCCPKFSRVMRIQEGYHPMLEHKRTKESVIKNNVIATPQYNFYLISGPNMSGKTVYIKMIAIIQIMGQIGCFVPAVDAQLRLTDKLFSRLGFQDNIEQNASSFTIELREMEYLYSNLTPNSLVIMDELCRSTNPQEGEVLCWSFCEKFLQLQEKNTKLKDITRPFIFLTTHFTSLTKLSEKYNNAINLHMLAEQKTIDGNQRLDFKFQIQSGATPIKSYGLSLARCLRFPTSLIDRAEELVDEIKDESVNAFMNDTKNESNVSNNSSESSIICTEMTHLEHEVIDLFSYILLLISTGKDGAEWINIDMVNCKIKCLIELMSPEFRDVLRNLSISEIISVLNCSRNSTI